MEIRVGERGRMVLPKKVRERLGLKQDSRLDLELGSNHLILRPKRTVRVRDVYGMIRGTRVKLEEIETALGDEIH